MYVGADIGSVSVNVAGTARDGTLLFVSEYARHEGRPVPVLATVLEGLVARFPDDRIEALVVTGSGRGLVTELIGTEALNDVRAVTMAMNALCPAARTVIEIGGKDAKLLLLGLNASSGRLFVEDSARNTLCAAGTGSFLDQQAARLGYSVEEFGAVASKSRNPANISGRCSVFAKSDLIHLQQIATPDYDMLSGLCYAVVHNFLSSVSKGKRLVAPIVLIGGVAANAGVVRAFGKVLDVGDKGLVVPEHFGAMPAIGAALAAAEGGPARELGPPDFAKLKECSAEFRHSGKRMPPLTLRASEHRLNRSPSFAPEGTRRMPVYLGVDVGSISTNVVAVDTDACLVARYYGWTSGRPIEAVRQGIGKIAAQVGRSVTVEGVGVTGSGRYLIGDFIGSDVVRNEITAQATASIHIDPTVDTILEIGGQDSKFIAVENGVITDFAMNKVCAAGTGSFLEEQAERMDIDLQKDFGRLALESQAPVSCAERCTVFMEQDLAQCLQAGVDRKDLAAGLCYSIASNYLNKVAIRHKIGRNVFFQGAVAFNKGVVAALEQLLGRPVTVPPNHDVTGAIGAAMLALSASPEESRFRGFESIIRKRYELTSFVCTHCENRCSISKVDIDGQNPLFYGDRCDERYGKSRIRRSVRTCGPDLFARREEFLMRSWVPSAPGDAPTVGIPRALLFHEQLPFWRAFFTALRFRVVLSDRTNRAQVNRGVRHTPTETCFPVKVLYGHVLDLLAKDVDYLFLPTVVDHPQTRRKYAGSIRFNCPFVQTAGYMVRAGIDMREADVRVLQPTLYHGFSERRTRQALSAMGKSMGRAPADVKRALRTGEFAQQSFRRACLQAGRETLDAIRPDGMMFVLVARPYNGCDAALNLDLAKHLRELGVQSIPMDFLPLDEIDVLGEYENMYWHYGQKILAAAKIIARNRNLHAVYVSNFRCGPDAFITPFFQEIMDGKPFLHLEFDDHDADAGVVTRCEAFLDSLRNAKQTAGPVAARRKPGFCGEKTCTVYIPHMGDHAYALKAAFVAHGHPAEVMVSDDDSLRIGRQHSSGKECLPFVITTGDMVKATQAPGFDPERAAFFLASTRGPCRFGLYSDVQRIVLDKLGLSQVPIIAPNQASALLHQIRVSGPGFFRLMWRGCVAYELLGRLLREIRPYEVNAGETDRVYDVCKQDLYDTLVRSGDAVGALKRARAAFEHVPVDRSVVRPRIGIVGEVFVRMHEYSNGHVVRKIETLGGEVCLPGFQEWMYHCNHSLRQYALARGKCRLLAQVWVQDRLQKREEKRALAAVRPLLVGTKEPDTRQLWENAGTYFLPWFGEASLGIGKSVEYARTGASGIVNLMPFTCLIGSICKTQLQPFRRDYGQIPVLNLEYDGLEESAFMDDLEPFMDQARDYLGTGVIQGK